MWKLNSKYGSSLFKQVLSMFRFVEAFHLTSEWECATLSCGLPKSTKLPTNVMCYCASPSVSWPQFANIYSLKRNCLQLVELLNLFIYRNQKFIQDDLDVTMTMWTDSETTKCSSNTCWVLLLLTVKIAVRATNL